MSVVGTRSESPSISDDESASPSVRLALRRARLVAADGADRDNLGYSVGISGNVVVAGARSDDNEAGHLAGAAYVFVPTPSGWIQQAKLMASDARDYDEFGSSVAIDGDTIIVGAPERLSGGGVAFVFVRSGTTWTQQAELTPSDRSHFDTFGASVAIDGDTALIGDQHADAPGQDDAGAAYVFVRSGTTWTEQAKLTASDALTDDHFGYSVSLSGDTALIADITGLFVSRAAYVFVRSGTAWTQQAELESGLRDVLFDCVAVDGATAALGDPTNDDQVRLGGAVYVFVRSGTAWTKQATLFSPDGNEDEGLGSSVAVEGDRIIAGATGAGPPEKGGGAAFVFKRSGTTWSPAATLRNPNPAVYDAFGGSVDLSGSASVVGAYGDIGGAGAAYVYWR
jgi:hypothetical protein